MLPSMTILKKASCCGVMSAVTLPTGVPPTRSAVRSGEKNHRRNLLLGEQRAAQEFVFPARDALDVEQPVARIHHLDVDRVFVVVLVLLARQRRHEHAIGEDADLRVLELERQLPLAALVGNLRRLFAAQLAVFKNLHRDGRAARALTGNLHLELRFPPDGDAPRSRHRVDAQIRLLLPAARRLEAQRVNGERPLGGGPVVQRLARVRAVAEQEQAGDVQTGGALGDFFQSIAQPRGRALGLERGHF